MSINSYLQREAQSLLISSLETSSIRTSIDAIDSRLRGYFGAGRTEHIQFGSSTRATMLPRGYDERSDVDYMVVFDDGSTYQPQTLLDRLRRFAEHWYSSSEIKQSRPTLVLELGHIMFDLVPAYRSWGTLYIPAPASSFLNWTSTDPNDLNERLTALNDSNSYSIKPMIRLLKRWNARSGYVFDSYGLEKWVAGRVYFFDRNLRDYLCSTVLALPEPWDFAKWRLKQIRRAKDIVTQAKHEESLGLIASAEAGIARLF